MVLRAFGASSCRGVFGALLVGVLLILPSLVRATQHLSASHDSSPIRLNRGFDQPQAKCRPAPPNAPIVQRSATLDDAVVAQAPCVSPIAKEPTPDSPAPPSPDPLRGPPSLLVG